MKGWVDLLIIIRKEEAGLKGSQPTHLVHAKTAVEPNFHQTK